MISANKVLRSAKIDPAKGKRRDTGNVIWKLFDPDGKVLATCSVGYTELMFFEELGGELELMSMLGMLALRYRNLRLLAQASYMPVNNGGGATAP